jgi:hypothetical protein
MVRDDSKPIELANRKGPRFNTRTFRKKIISKELYIKWKTKSGHNNSYDEFKVIWKAIAKEYQVCAVEGPNGVLMPYGIGELYIGWTKTLNRVIDYNLSRVHNTRIYHENYHSYGKLAKIIYHACGKYRLDTCKLWNFKPITPFKQYVSKTLKDSPEIYKNSRQKTSNGYTSSRTPPLTTEEPSKTS